MLRTELQAASAVLEKRSKIQSAIDHEVAELSGLIAAQLQTEREFRRLECSKAIGEPAAGLEKARKAAADAKDALQDASFKLGGFRTQLGEMGTDLVRIYDELAAKIPEYNQRIIEAFTTEWEAAVGAFQAALSRRAAIEGLVRQRLNLPDPIPQPTDVGEMGTPHETLAEIGAAIKAIASAKTISERPLKSGTFYNPAGIYRLTSDRMASRGLPKGSFVIDASFEPGRLAQLLEHEEARPVLDRDQVQGISDAATKAAEIDKTARDRELAESERRLRGNDDENLKNSGRVPDLSYHPTQADLDRAAQKRAAIDAHVPLTATREY